MHKWSLKIGKTKKYPDQLNQSKPLLIILNRVMRPKDEDGTCCEWPCGVKKRKKHRGKKKSVNVWMTKWHRWLEGWMKANCRTMVEL